MASIETEERGMLWVAQYPSQFCRMHCQWSSAHQGSEAEARGSADSRLLVPWPNEVKCLSTIGCR
jgi:hypothetical protein